MIHIKDEWYIDADQYGYMLKKIVGKDKKGKDVCSKTSFHSTAAGALKNYGELRAKEIVENEDIELNEAILRFRGIVDELEQLASTLTVR